MVDEMQALHTVLASNQECNLLVAACHVIAVRFALAPSSFLESLFGHCWCANLQVAARTTRSNANHLYTAGLLHQIRLVLYCAYD